MISGKAPALTIINKLLEKGAEVTAFDPEAMENVKKKIGDAIAYASTMYSALEDADALIICTEWSIFRLPTFKNSRKSSKPPLSLTEEIFMIQKT